MKYKRFFLFCAYVTISTFQFLVGFETPEDFQKT